MKQHTIQTAIALALLASSAVHAQDAVQWKVANGGNGHWYTWRPCTTGVDANVKAMELHGDLVSITSVEENEHARQILAESGRTFAMLGYIQADNQPGPGIGWAWSSGEPTSFTNWTDFDGGYGFVAPDDRPCAGATAAEDNQCNQGIMYPDGRWDDIERGSSCGGFASSSVAIIEWSADCNNDGIVDYGQCRDGTLPDYNGNNIPDCCERGDACVLSHYPVQWRVEDGGNGHWYRTVVTTSVVTWTAAANAASDAGSHLATLNSDAENRFVYLLARSQDGWSGFYFGPWIGGYAEAGMNECDTHSWRWITGEPWDPMSTAWCPSQPDCGGETRLHYWYCTNGWNNAAEHGDYGWGAVTAYVAEWDADCNNDGIVDYGQILQGQFADANTDGIPDMCQCGAIPSLPTCCPGDLDHDGEVGGADIGLLLSNWGPCGSACLYDLNNDGKVNGGDLGLLLSGWGPCAN